MGGLSSSWNPTSSAFPLWENGIWDITRGGDNGHHLLGINSGGSNLISFGGKASNDLVNFFGDDGFIGGKFTETLLGPSGKQIADASDSRINKGINDANKQLDSTLTDYKTAVQPNVDNYNTSANAAVGVGNESIQQGNDAVSNIPGKVMDYYNPMAEKMIADVGKTVIGGSGHVGGGSSAAQRAMLERMGLLSGQFYDAATKNALQGTGLELQNAGQNANIAGQNANIADTQFVNNNKIADTVAQSRMDMISNGLQANIAGAQNAAQGLASQGGFIKRFIGW